MSKYVKLPNGKVVLVDENNVLIVKVMVDLSEVINRSLEELLDLLSDLATGTELLSDISYSVVGHSGNTLELTVRGDINLIEVDEVVVDELPMLEFDVDVTRIGYGERTLRLSARTVDEAENLADADAGNHYYSEHHSNYVISARVI